MPDVLLQCSGELTADVKRRGFLRGKAKVEERIAAHAARPDGRSGGISKSAEIRNRSRSLRTMDMLNSRLPFKTSLTLLAVPRIGIRSEQERPC